MDIDIDDLIDGPKKAPARASRFAPKGSKFQPKPKPKPKTEPSSTSASVSLPTPKKEEVDDKAKMKPKHEDNIVDMDVDISPDSEKVDIPDDPMKIEGAGEEVGPGDGDEDEIVQEIDVYFSPCIDPETQVAIHIFLTLMNFNPILCIVFVFSSFRFADGLCNNDEIPIMMHCYFLSPVISVAISAQATMAAV